MAGAIERAIERIPKIGQLGGVITGVLHRALVGSGRTGRKLANVLHGTWLRHPLHPMLTDVTIGAWLLGGMFDAVAAITGSSRAKWAGDRLAETGTVTAVPTAITGAVEYASAPKPAVTTATLHSLLNNVGFGLYLLSVWQRRRGKHHQGYALSWTAQGIVLGSAWLGGMLVYKHRVGVDHSERFTGPETWTRVLDDEELPDQTPKRIELDGKGVLLYRENGHIYAIGSVCAHAGGPLEEGAVKDGCVQCPWHHSVYDLRDGSVVYAPSTRPQPTFETRVRDGAIELRLTSEPEQRRRRPTHHARRSTLAAAVGATR